MIESFFSKMTRQMLRGIRVNTKQELEERIYKYFDEVNREPVVYHWKYKMDEMIAILSDREEFIKKKEMEQAQAVINEIYRNGL